MALGPPQLVMLPSPQVLILPPPQVLIPQVVMRPPEFLPRDEPLGGYVFVCSNETMRDCFRRQIFGLGFRYRDSVREIRPGMPLFLYNYSTKLLHGIFEATAFGGINIDPFAWPEPNFPGRSRYPSQVRVRLRMARPPLIEELFRPLVARFGRNRFRHELSVPEVVKILEIFESLHGHCVALAKAIEDESAVNLPNDV